MARRNRGTANNIGPNGIDTVTSFLGYEMLLEHWIDNIEQVSVDALERVVGDVEQVATETTAYNDDTSATRNSTIAYVATSATGLPAEVGIAQAVANGYRPGSATDDQPPEPAPDTVELVAYSATDYSFFLNIRGGGTTMYLADAIELNIGHAMAELERAWFVLLNGNAA